MICSFFKFSILEHFWVLKWIAWVDIRVVLIFYSFQGVRVDLEGELEKWTKCTQIGKLAKLQLIVIMIVFLAFQLKWYISNSKVKPPLPRLRPLAFLWEGLKRMISSWWLWKESSCWAWTKLTGREQRRQRGFREATIWLWQCWEAMCKFFDDQIYHLHMYAI